MRIKISVIVPIYNTGDYLKKCIDSIIEQTYKNLEIILVDNKSTDNSGEICDEYAEFDSRVIAIHRKEHGWVSDGRNDGIIASTGDWISFIDSDDWVEKNMYQYAVDRFEKRFFDILCYGGCICEYPGNKSQMTYTGPGGFEYQNRDKIIHLAKNIFIPIWRKDAPSINMSAPWDKIYRAEFIKSNNIEFDREVLFADDSYFNIMAFSLAKRVLGTSYIGYHYRQNVNSITHKYRPDWPDKIYHYLEKLKKYIVDVCIYDSMRDAYAFVVFRCFLNMLRGMYLNPSCELSKKEVKEALIMWKEHEIYHALIWDKSNTGLSKKMIILKWILRKPYIFPLRIVMKIERLKK